MYGYVSVDQFIAQMRKACPEIVENFRKSPINGRSNAPRKLSTKTRNITKMHSDNNEEKRRYKDVLEHGTYLGYHSQPLVHIIRNIHIRVHSTHLMTFIFLNLDFLLSDGSGRVIIIVVIRCRSVSCSRDRLETTKCVVRNPCQLKFTNVRNTEGLIQKILSLISFFEG